jgi:hypothetical protein
MSYKKCVMKLKFNSAYRVPAMRSGRQHHEQFVPFCFNHNFDQSAIRHTCRAGFDLGSSSLRQFGLAFDGELRL